MRVVFTVVAGAVLLLTGSAFAAEGHGHGGHHPADAQMAKLHKMMPRYGAAQMSINAALEEGDMEIVRKETAYLLSTTADLKKSRPHKNVARLQEFRKIAAGFEQDVKMTAEFAQKGDRAGAKAAFTGAEKACDSCHAKFRD